MMNRVGKKEYDLTASIVLFHSDEEEIKHVIECFLSSTLSGKIYLIDNSLNDELKTLGNIKGVEYIFLNNNIGYGAAHNVAIFKSKFEADYHVVLNPDISFESRILIEAHNYMVSNNDVGMLSPKIVYPDGTPQYMCRLLPTPFDLIVRRFLPSLIKPLFNKLLNNYILKKLDYTKKHNIPNLPGSFMFLRNSAISEVGGFDEKFFMYLEDVDLTRRIHSRFKTIFYPHITVVHALEQGSYKSKKLLQYHIQSAFYYFKKWGWLVDKERTRINSILLKQLNNEQK
ncbi:glycosyltransferase family 2 protein [Pedobacter sp. KACC 23697]|uniref:Glycosyltransferase family 2 protein n=1 Tax=Pedobacter sp. KACC 23697 TaxID=3149230 RepID=A0AAU7K2Y5_9SPHI